MEGKKPRRKEMQLTMLFQCFLRRERYILSRGNSVYFQLNQISLDLIGCLRDGLI